MRGRRAAGDLSGRAAVVSLPCSRKMALLAGLGLLLAAPAHAELGGPASTVRTDGARMSARMVSANMAGYTLHTLTRPNGGTVHELEIGRAHV